MTASFTPDVLKAGAGFLALALALGLFVRAERRNVARLTVVYLLSLAFRAAAVIFHGTAMTGTAATFGFLAHLLQGLAFVWLAAALVFAVVLAGLRLQPPRIVRDLTTAGASLVLVFSVLATHNVDVTGIVATSAVVTAIIGFSLQDTLGNVMGGLALQLDGSVGVGDAVRFGDVVGVVREVTWRYVSLATKNGDRVIVPNSVFMKSQVLALGKAADVTGFLQRRWVRFHVDYRAQPPAVIAAVLEALRREPPPAMTLAPAPDVLLLEFQDSWATYAVRYWLTDYWQDEVTDSLVRTRLVFALRRAGIPMSIPAQSVFLTSEDRERQEHVREKEKRARLNALETVSLFDTLTEQEKDLLAEGLSFAPFAPGEAMVVQGSAVHHLYILSKGSAEVRVSVEGAPARAVRRLEAPDFFGERGLLTGEPRTATVVALDAVECWRLHKERFQGILAARPQIADDISRVLAVREVELFAVREGLSEEARRARLAQEHSSLLTKIQHFFEIT